MSQTQFADTTSANQVDRNFLYLILFIYLFILKFVVPIYKSFKSWTCFLCHKNTSLHFVTGSCKWHSGQKQCSVYFLKIWKHVEPHQTSLTPSSSCVLPLCFSSFHFLRPPSHVPILQLSATMVLALLVQLLWCTNRPILSSSSSLRPFLFLTLLPPRLAFSLLDDGEQNNRGTSPLSSPPLFSSHCSFMVTITKPSVHQHEC